MKILKWSLIGIGVYLIYKNFFAKSVPPVVAKGGTPIEPTTHNFTATPKPVKKKKVFMGTIDEYNNCVNALTSQGVSAGNADKSCSYLLNS